MKSIKKLFVFLILFTIINSLTNNLLVATKYVCCSPYGACAFREFDSKYTCMQGCPSHHECQVKDVEDADDDNDNVAAKAAALSVDPTLTSPVTGTPAISNNATAGFVD